MNPSVKLVPNQGEPYFSPKRYKRLVGKLSYLIVTHPNITFSVNVLSEFLNSPCHNHWNAVLLVMKYIMNSLGKGILYEDKENTQIVWYSDAN